MFNAIDVAKWFMENNEDTPKNTLQGNMKLQKLLFFSQLIHIARTDRYLIKEEFNAYDKGMVMESIRLLHFNNMRKILEDGKTISDIEALETLRLTNEIYGDATADELSDLSHQFEFWRKYLNNSKTIFGYKIKSKSVVPNSELRKEIQVIKDVLKANEMMNENIVGDDFDY